MDKNPPVLDAEILEEQAQSKIGPTTLEPLDSESEMDDAPEVYAVDIWDRSEPRSIVNLVPEKVSRAIEQLPEEMRDLDEKTLREKVRPSATDSRLRLAFWNEYERAQGKHSKMTMSNIYGGICSKTYFIDKYITRPENVAWMICPVVSYMKAAEECLHFGMDQMREVLALPNIDAKGKVNTSLINVKKSIVQSLEMRIRGAIPMVQKNLNINANLTDKQAAEVAGQAVAKMSMEQVQKRIESLRRKKERMAARPNGSEPIDTEVVIEQGKETRPGT